jgi:type I restriction enzyme S subunit
MKASYIDKLLNGAKVEWTVLGNEKYIEIANSQRKPVKADSRIPGENPYYGANNIQDYVEGYTHDGEFILVAEDGSASLKNYSIQWAVGKFWANNHVHVLRGKGDLNNRFLYHYLKTINFIPFLSGGERAKLTKTKLIQIPIPIPPLPVQQEIVRILDAFTKLTAELTAELTARKKQYEYYRDKLLTPIEDNGKWFLNGKEVEWKTLGEVGKLVRGNGLQKSDFRESGVPAIHYGQIYTYYGTFATETKSFVSPTLATKLRKARKNDLIIATTSENIEDVCKPLVWLGEDEVCVSGETYIFKHNQNPKYLAYFLQTPMFFDYKKKNRTGTKVIRVHGDKLKQFKIPIPPLEEQERIVSILDKFDALTNSITEGLPREIELRQKQYEYYRDMLLSFPKEGE